MTEQPRYVHAFLCDDIRLERNGKLSFMGVPDTFVHVNGPLPARIEPLHLVIFATTPAEEPFRRFVLRVSGAVNGTEPVVFDLTRIFDDPDVMNSPDGRLSLWGQIDLPPLTVESAVSIDVIVETERDTLRVARFPVRLNDTVA